MERKIKEVVEFEFYQTSENENVTSPIKVHVQIDYKNDKISIVQPEAFNGGEFESKKYLFANRGVAFMNSWLNILEAMQSAIREAKKKMEKYQEDEQKNKDDDVTEILLQATEIVKGKSKKIK